jgi:protein-disulfide isomerase
MAGRRLFALSPGDLATAILVVCAVVITVVAVRREFGRTPSVRPIQPIGIEERWQEFVGSGHIYGETQAPVAVVEFGDYECPACRLLQTYVDSLLSSGLSFRLEYRHFPLRGHRLAIPAARASDCAAAQAAFKPMHQALFKHADSLGLVPWWWYARMAGVSDSAAFEACIRSEAPSHRLSRDTVDGRRLGVALTPTLLIGPMRVNGVPPLDSLKAYIERARGRGS